MPQKHFEDTQLKLRNYGITLNELPIKRTNSTEIQLLCATNKLIQ